MAADTNQTLDRSDYLVQMEMSVLCTIFVLAVCGSSLVIALLIPKRRKLARVHHFMLNLSIADLLVAVFHILPTILVRSTPNGYLEFGGDFLCKAYNCFLLLPIYGSSNILVMTAVDRYTAICHPLRNYSWTKRRTYSLVAVSWIGAFLLAAPQLYFFEYDYGTDMCSDKWNLFPTYAVLVYTVYYLTFVFLLPLILLTFMYGKISYIVWKSASARNSVRRCRNSHADDVRHDVIGDKNGVATVATNAHAHTVDGRRGTLTVSERRQKQQVII